MGLFDRLQRSRPHPTKGRPGLRPDDPCPCGSGKPVRLCCAELLK